MIFVALGGNLPHLVYGDPPAPCEAALKLLESQGVAVLRRSPWYCTAPVPASGQPDYANGVVEVFTGLAPPALLALLHGIEAKMGRARSAPNAARIIDLDLLDYDGRIVSPRGAGLVLPHPRMDQRAFVLLPLRDIAPLWRHPVTDEPIDTLISRLSADQACQPLEAP